MAARRQIGNPALPEAHWRGFCLQIFMNFLVCAELMVLAWRGTEIPRRAAAVVTIR